MPTPCTTDRFFCISKNALNLFIQFIAIGDDDHTRIGIILQNPLRKENHHDALPTPLRMPDDPSLVVAYTLLGFFDTEILVDAREFFSPPIEEDEVVHQFDDPLLSADFQEIFVELEATIIGLILLPPEKQFLLGFDGPILQPFGVVSCEHELDCAEEPSIERRLLVREVLADTIAD